MCPAQVIKYVLPSLQGILLEGRRIESLQESRSVENYYHAIKNVKHPGLCVDYFQNVYSSSTLETAILIHSGIGYYPLKSLKKIYI